MSDTTRPTSPSAAAPPVPSFDERGTLIERLGIVVREVRADRAVGTMPVAGNTQQIGRAHV